MFQAKKVDRKLNRVALMVSVKGIKMSDLETGNITFDFSIYRWVKNKEYKELLKEFLDFLSDFSCFPNSSSELMNVKMFRLLSCDFFVQIVPEVDSP